MSRTVLFAPCYLDGKDALGNSRFDRNVRWVEWYRQIRDRLGIDEVWLLDNASQSMSRWVQSHREAYYWQVFPHHLRHVGSEHVFIFNEALSTRKGSLDYPYCWRALWFGREFIEAGFTKLLFIDTDAFILSSRMADHIKNLKTGWESFYVPKYGFPSAECHVLCEDAFPTFLKYTSEPWEKKVGKLMETDLPFTQVNREFNCDRFGEDGVSQKHGMDAYFQARLTTPLAFTPA